MVEEFKKESEELFKEVASELTPQGIKETSEESEKPEEAKETSEESEKPEEAKETSEESEKTEEAKETSEESKKTEEAKETSEESEKIEEAKETSEESEKIEETSEESKKVEDSLKESKPSTKEQTPVGITDEELSRVFESIPRKSKVALNRVESRMDSVKGSKSSPSWYPWVFSLIMIVGLIWSVVYYLTGNYPIPNIGAWNLVIAFVTILVGFVMTMAWK